MVSDQMNFLLDKFIEEHNGGRKKKANRNRSHKTEQEFVCMKINKAGLDLIKHFEGFRAEAYLDPIDIPTIGYGHTKGVTQENVRNRRTITEEHADMFLRKDVAVAEVAVERLISVSLNENQFSALVSFTFNLGSGNLRSSTLRWKLNQGYYDVVPEEMVRWTKAGGKTLSGLVRRREAEKDLFMTPVGPDLEWV